MKQKVINFIKEHKLFFLYTCALCVLWFFIGKNIMILLSKSDNINVSISNPIVLDLSKDRDFLTCIYDQLECYDKNLGYLPQEIRSWCGDIKFCDSKK